MRRKTLLTVAVILAALDAMPWVGMAAGPPATIAAWTGTPQSTAANTNFQVALVAVVRDTGGNGVQGASVTFSAPASGASGTFGSSTAASIVTDGNGLAIAPTFRANAVGGSYSVTASVAGVGTGAPFAMSNTGGGGSQTAPAAPTNLRIVSTAAPGPPSSVSATAGGSQTTIINAAFGTALRATVRDASSNALSGVTVTFTAPASGASARFGSSATASAVTDSSGVATAPTLTANGTVGSYTVAASVSGVSGTAAFNLANSSSAPPPSSSGTWSKASVPVSFKYAMCLVGDPVRPSDFYAFVTNGAGTQISVVKSTDFGASWNKINSSTFSGDPWGCAIDPNPNRNPSTPPTMYTPAGYGSMGLFRSTDGGVNWTQMFGSQSASQLGSVSRYWPPDLYHVAILPDSPNHILVTFHAGGWNGSDGGLGESRDGGNTWVVHSPPSGMGQSQYLIIADADNWITVAQDADGGNGVWKTSTAGRTGGQVSTSAWRRVETFEHLHGDFVPVITGGVIYAPSSRGIFRSTNKGDTWQSVYSGAIGTLAVTDSFLYANFSLRPTILRAAKNNDTNWATYGPHAANFKANEIGPGTSTVASSTDGTRWYIVAAINDGGIWRYAQ